jgi:hypothetical protein
MTVRLPDWLAQWFDVEPSTTGGGATFRLVFAWPLPPWATLLVVLFAVACVGLIYAYESSAAGQRYRTLLAALRLAALAILLVMLTQATLLLQRTGPPAIAVIVDRSASMGIVDKYESPPLAPPIVDGLKQAGLGEASRLNLAKLLLAENNSRLLRKLADNYRLNLYLTADGTERLAGTETTSLSKAVTGLSADGSGSQATRLGDAVRQVLEDSRGTPPAAILLFTDGVVTEGASLADAAADARQHGAPLIAVGLGSDQGPHDIEVADVLVDDTVFIDDLVSFAVQIKATGLEGQTAAVVLRRDGESKSLSEQTVTLGPDGQPQTVLLTDRPTTAGETPYFIEVTPRDDETNRANNRQRRMVSVRDAKIHVLLAFGYPSYEHRFLKTLLERDSTIQLSTYLQDADPDSAAQDRTALRSFPVARDELFDYDVLILGDMDPRLLPRSVWTDLRKFVAEKGGGVVFIAGPRFLPWLYADVSDATALFPVEFDALASTGGGQLPKDISGGFVVQPTPLGLQAGPMQLGDTLAEAEQIWRTLSPLYWLAQVDRLKPAAQVWAEHPTDLTSQGRHLPVIVNQFFGAGKVLFHAIDSTWRWRVGVGDVYFARYWVQAIRYLARGKLNTGRGAEITTARREYRQGETVAVRARFLDERLAPAGDEVTLTIESPGQARNRTTLHRSATVGSVFEGSLAGLREGTYELLLSEPQLPGHPPAARFTIVTPPGEMARLAMDRAALTAAAETTHGKFYTMADAERLANELPRGRRMLIENLPPVELWNRWWLLAPFLALVISEWILRRRKGML